MTTKSEFNGEEWETIAAAPAIAGLIVASAQRGGTIRESFAMAKTYAEARREQTTGELVGEIVGSAPHVDTKEFSSKEDLRTRGLGKISEAVELVRGKATVDELVDYREFVLSVANHAAEADKSGGFLGIGGERVTGQEEAAISDITTALGEAPADDAPSA
jgi:hypothetical protein